MYMYYQFEKFLCYMYVPEYNWYKGRQHKAAFIMHTAGDGGTEDIF